MGEHVQKRPLSARRLRIGEVTNSTAASTALEPNDAIGLTSTSTTGPVVYTLSRIPKPGEQLGIVALTVGASSAGAGYHVNAASGTFFGSSSQDMATLLGHGDGFSAIAMSTTRWGVIGNNNATFSTST